MWSQGTNWKNILQQIFATPFPGLVPGLKIEEKNGSPGLTAEEELGTYNITEKIGVSARGGQYDVHYR